MTLIFLDRIRWQHRFAGKIPERTLAALNRYVQDGQLPGGFLIEVLSNRLFGAIHMADDENLAALPALVRLIYNELPSGCWGNRAKVAGWTEKKQGVEKETK